jgi:membrane-bound lytic murein transglycosylase B
MAVVHRLGHAARARARGAAALAAAAGLIAGCGGGHAAAQRPAQTPAPTATATPAPTATATPAPPIPRTPAALAADLVRTDAALRAALTTWVERGHPARGLPSAAVSVPAARQRAIYVRMSDRRRLGDATVKRLHGRAAADARAAVQARRMLVALTPHGGHIRLGRPEPAGVLLRHYREAQRRSHVDWHLLAAVNFVESAFGRLRNDSVAGAQGPMQFIPSTWRQYGRGDVHDPRAAILAAGRFLHAAGAPRHERAALYRYNPSPLYVGAVERYAGRMRRDRLAFYAYYAWPPPR